jgi:hypothetical protein
LNSKSPPKKPTPLSTPGRVVDWAKAAIRFFTLDAASISTPAEA